MVTHLDEILDQHGLNRSQTFKKDERGTGTFKKLATVAGAFALIGGAFGAGYFLGSAPSQQPSPEVKPPTKTIVYTHENGTFPSEWGTNETIVLPHPDTGYVAIKDPNDTLNLSQFLKELNINLNNSTVKDIVFSLGPNLKEAGAIVRITDGNNSSYVILNETQTKELLDKIDNNQLNDGSVGWLEQNLIGRIGPSNLTAYLNAIEIGKNLFGQDLFGKSPDYISYSLATDLQELNNQLTLLVQNYEQLNNSLNENLTLKEKLKTDFETALYSYIDTVSWITGQNLTDLKNNSDLNGVLHILNTTLQTYISENWKNYFEQGSAEGINKVLQQLRNSIVENYSEWLNNEEVATIQNNNSSFLDIVGTYGKIMDRMTKFDGPAEWLVTNFNNTSAADGVLEKLLALPYWNKTYDHSDNGTANFVGLINYLKSQYNGSLPSEIQFLKDNYNQQYTVYVIDTRGQNGLGVAYNPNSKEAKLIAIPELALKQIKEYCSNNGG
ncbi:MAG: hypothetical protein QXQ79_00250 [Candidatus Nanoarchaeia archaeon]